MPDSDKTPVFTKADVLSILADYQKALENNQELHNTSPTDYWAGKIAAYSWAISRIKSMMLWKGVNL